MALNYSTIGGRIKVVRKRKDISQTDLAERIGMSCVYMSYIESGERKMSLDTFVEITRALNVSSDELLADILPNKIRSTSQEMLTLLSDCSEFEGRVLLAILRGAKTAIRESMQKENRRP